MGHVMFRLVQVCASLCRVTQEKVKQCQLNTHCQLNTFYLIDRTSVL